MTTIEMVRKLEEYINTPEFREEAEAASLWRGADVVVRAEADKEAREFIKHREMVISSQESVPTKIAIITSFAKELSLVFKKMAEIYSNRIDHINKYDFYGEMGRAAYTFIQTKNPKDMCGILSAAIFSGCEVFENNKR